MGVNLRIKQAKSLFRNPDQVTNNFPKILWTIFGKVYKKFSMAKNPLNFLFLKIIQGRNNFAQKRCRTKGYSIYKKFPCKFGLSRNHKSSLSIVEKRDNFQQFNKNLTYGSMKGTFFEFYNQNQMNYPWKKQKDNRALQVITKILMTIYSVTAKVPAQAGVRSYIIMSNKPR